MCIRREVIKKKEEKAETTESILRRDLGQVSQTVLFGFAAVASD